MSIDLNLSFRYGKKVIFEDFSLLIPENKTTCILGVSGSGKTTLLNCIGGLLKYEGTIFNLPQKLSYVFQEPNLIDSLTVRGNLEYVLGGMDKEERNELIEEMLKSLELSDYGNTYTSRLSGGQRGRVALARAFVYQSSMILMDEPFTGLDIALKSRIITLFNKLLANQPKTVVYVTHSIDEALLLADKICILNKDGKLVDCIEISTQKTERSITQEKLSGIRARLLDIFVNLSVDR